MSTIYVLGHQNPDTDSIASAIAYAWKLSFEHGGDVVAARTGPVNGQTAWLLERLGVQPPMLLTDAAPQFGGAARNLPTVAPERPLREAWDILHDTGSVAPVVGADGRPWGLITGQSVFELVRGMVATKAGGVDAKLSELLEVPCGEAADSTAPSFLARSRIRDGIDKVLRDEHDDFWVVDDDGSYVGVCRKPDLLNPERMQLVLVDHNASGQSVGSLEEAVVVEVLDHHRLENLPTHLPIRFHVEPVGSTSTLVWHRVETCGQPIPPSIAGLLLAGIISDTLLLQSPTTTQRDRNALENAARHAFAPGSPLEGETVASFGATVLRAGAGLDAKTPKEVVTGDLKVYESKGLKFGAAQVEVADEPDISSHVEPLRAALAALCEERGFDFAVLMITEVVGGWSQILLHAPPPALEELPYPRLADGTLEAKGVMSRKKQLLPAILALLER